MNNEKNKSNTLSSTGTEAWVMTEGSSIKLSTPPRLSAKAKILISTTHQTTTLKVLKRSIKRILKRRSIKKILSKNVVASSLPPFKKKVSIPPKPFICFLANSCWGCDGRPGYTYHYVKQLLTTSFILFDCLFFLNLCRI